MLAKPHKLPLPIMHVLLFVVTALGLLLAQPATARASWGSLTMRYNADGTISGTCHVVINASYESNGATGDRASQFYVTFPDGQVVIGYCGNSYFSEPDHGNHAQPGEDDYAFTATSNGNGSYNVTIHSENSRYVNNFNNYKATIEQCPGLFSRTRQRVYVPWWIPREGDVELMKVSENPELTDGNDAYSFEGAIYTVRNDDASLSSLDAYLYVDKNGLGTLRKWTDGTSPNPNDPRIKIPTGSYVIWEHAAPKGYQLDATQYRVSVSEGQVAKITVREKPTGGTLELLKVSANEALSSDNPCYTLAGAEYHVYRDESCTNDVGTLTCKEDGSTNTLTLSAGTYYVKETRASRGYALDPQVYEAKLETGKKTVIEAHEIPQCNPVSVMVQKVDADLAAATPQGCAELQGAQFRIDFYAGYYDETASLPDKPTRSWTLETSARGQAVLADASKVAGDDFYYNTSGTPSLPLGTVAITEVKAPLGYTLPQDASKLFKITPDGTEETLACYVEPDPGNPTTAEQVCRGGVQLLKHDDQGNPLAGAAFSVVSTSPNPVVVDGTTFEKGDVCLTLRSGDDGIASCPATTLPYGTYEIWEARAPRGHPINADWKESFSIEQDGQMVDLTSRPCINPTTTVSVVLEAMKEFDGASQGRSIQEGQFTFLLKDAEGNVLQTKTNDAAGMASFDALTFNFDDLGTHEYTIVEEAGSDEEIVYDEHVEQVTVEVIASDEWTLDAVVKTDDDGIVFHNATVPAIGLPLTGEDGAKGVAASTTLAMLAGTTAGSRFLGRRRR